MSWKRIEMLVSGKQCSRDVIDNYGKMVRQSSGSHPFRRGEGDGGHWVLQ